MVVSGKLELAPGVHLGSYWSLSDKELIETGNIKIIVNCGNTSHFLNHLDGVKPVISSEVVVLNLDPSISGLDEDYKRIHSQFNKVLKNYLAFFYNYNEKVSQIIHLNYMNDNLTFESPNLDGMPLILFFKINRFLKLMQNLNSEIGVLFVSDSFGCEKLSNGVIYSLAILYLMDNYGFDFDASFGHLRSALAKRFSSSESGHPHIFAFNHYDHMILVNSLKVFFEENLKIKNKGSVKMTTHANRKRRIDSVDSFVTQAYQKRLV